MTRKIHTSATGSHYIVKGGKKLYGAPMQKVLQSEGQKLPKKANTRPKPAKKANTKPKPAKKANTRPKPAKKANAKPASGSNSIAKMEARLKAAHAKLRQARNANRPDATHTVGVHEYWREAPASAHLKARRRGQQDLFGEMGWAKNPKNRGRIVYNPETEEFVQVPEHLAEAYEMFQGNEVDECLLIEGPSYFPDEVFVIGEMPNIDYETAKGHINAGELVHYTHTCGEEGGERPILCSDEYGNLLILGGDFTLHSEGIRN